MRKESLLKIIFSVIFLFVICSILFSSLENNETMIIIKNNSNENIGNLIVFSNNSEEYTIDCIGPHEAFEFEYSLNEFNENALNMKQVIGENRSNDYNILGYIDRAYKEIFIYIDSIDEDYILSIRVETF